MSIDTSLSNIWKSWYLFEKGKKKTGEFYEFFYYLERNLAALQNDLQNGTYRHGHYRTFIVSDSKRRIISVASIRDRIVHRLLYEYLASIYDKAFIFDVWSCRKGKGLTAAIARTQTFLHSFPDSWIWRVDIKKFFDSVDQSILLEILSHKITDITAMSLLEIIVASYSVGQRKGWTDSNKGIPIGNLTSQIFANIYLNELDRFVAHDMRSLRYLRYGDDFFVIGDTYNEIVLLRSHIMVFLSENLRLEINSNNDIIIKTRRGIHFLGVDIFPNGKRLRQRVLKRIYARINLQNAASYYGLLAQHGNIEVRGYYSWLLLKNLKYE